MVHDMSAPVDTFSLTRLRSQWVALMDMAKKDCLKDPSYETYISIWQRCQASMDRTITTYEQTLLHREWKRWVVEAPAIEHLREEVLVQSEAGMNGGINEGIRKLGEYFKVDLSVFAQCSPEDIKKDLFFLSRISKISPKRKVSYTEFEYFRSRYWSNTIAFKNNAADDAIGGFVRLINVLHKKVPAQDVKHSIQVYSEIISKAHLLYDLSLEQFFDEFPQIERDIEELLQTIKAQYGAQNQGNEIVGFFSSLKKKTDVLLRRIEAEATSLSSQVNKEIPRELNEDFFRTIRVGDPETAFRAAQIVNEAIQKKNIPGDFVMHMMQIDTLTADLYIEFISAYESMASTYKGEMNKFNAFMKAVCYCPDNVTYLSTLREYPEMMRKLLQYPWTEFTPLHLGSMFRFIGAGASLDQFFVLYKHHGQFGCVSEEYLYPDDIALIKQFDLESLEQIYLLPDRFSIQEKSSMLTNRSLCLFATRFANSTLCARAILTIWELLQKPKMPLGSVDIEMYEAAREVLDPQERAFLLTGVNTDQLSIRDFYDLEASAKLDSVIQSIELSRVPTEPLIRYLSSQSTQESIQWLETEIPVGSRVCLRIETLSEEQKKQIVRRFRRFGSVLPQEEWMRAFHIDEQTAFEICRFHVSEPSFEDERWHAYLQQLIDPRDPASLFKALWNDEADRPLFERFQAIVLELLLHAKEHTMCGAREFVSWGNGADETSLCHAQDGRPLFARVHGNKIPVYQTDLFNDPLFPVAALSLRKRLLQVLSTMSKETLYQRKGLTGEALELRYELDRIASHLCERYSYLGFLDDFIWNHEEEITARERLIAKDMNPQSFSDDSPSQMASIILNHYKSFLSSEEWRSSTTLLELVKALYTHLTRYELFSRMHDIQSRSSTAAYCLMTLLLLSRYAYISENQDCSTVSLSPRTRYRIQGFTNGDYDVTLVDNPCLTPHQFFEVLSEYAPHSATPLSPNRTIGRTCFTSLAHAIQSLPPAAFYSLCANCLSLRSIEDCTVTQYVEALKDLSGHGDDIPVDALMSISDLLDHYMSFVSEATRPLEPNAIYYFNPRGVGDFSPSSEIPSGIASEGNFASAICHFFTPVLPTSCDGNCCVEAILLSEKGKDTYRGVDGAAQLKVDIRDFRQRVAQFGRENKEELQDAIGDGVEQRQDGSKEMETVDRFLRTYDASPYTEWTSPAAFFCAARVLHRPIRIFSHPSDVFMTDGDGMLVPSACFAQGVDEGKEPIHLMFWGKSHYCLLLPKRSELPTGDL